MKSQSIYLNFLNQPRSTTELCNGYFIGSVNYLVKIEVYASDKPEEGIPISIYMYAESTGEAIELVKDYFSIILKESVHSYRVIETKPLI